jgi:hypothetical protein
MASAGAGGGGWVSQLRVFSNGGGVQSTAALVLSAQGRIDFPVHLFCNVGDDSEHPATLRYVREVATPYAAANGIALHELRRIKRDGTVETLLGRITKPGYRGINIPMRLAGSGKPGIRSCTHDFKIRVICRWLRQRGASPENPAISGLGISVDEFQRARTDSGIPYQRLDYPLLVLRLTRQDCRNIIERAGLPIPPKSSCWFCPYHRLAVWQQMRHDEPGLFWKSVELERQLSDRHESIGKGAAYMTDKLVPLDRATSPHRQLPMFPGEREDACESGYCMT